MYQKWQPPNILIVEWNNLIAYLKICMNNVTPATEQAPALAPSQTQTLATTTTDLGKNKLQYYWKK